MKRRTTYPFAWRTASRARSRSKAMRWPCASQPSVSTITRSAGQVKSGVNGGRGRCHLRQSEAGGSHDLLHFLLELAPRGSRGDEPGRLELLCGDQLLEGGLRAQALEPVAGRSRGEVDQGAQRCGDAHAGSGLRVSRRQLPPVKGHAGSRPACADRERQLERMIEPVDDPQHPCRAAMAQVGVRPASGEGGERPTTVSECEMADGVDPAVNDVQPAGPDPVVDGVARHAQGDELGTIHHAVAPRRERREPPVDVNVTPARRRMTLAGVSAVSVTAIRRRMRQRGQVSRRSGGGRRWPASMLAIITSPADRVAAG